MPKAPPRRKTKPSPSPTPKTYVNYLLNINLKPIFTNFDLNLNLTGSEVVDEDGKAEEEAQYLLRRFNVCANYYYSFFPFSSYRFWENFFFFFCFTVCDWLTVSLCLFVCLLPFLFLWDEMGWDGSCLFKLMEWNVVLVWKWVISNACSKPLFGCGQ